ncbi:MAG: RAMP superfamily CRISPR-associated protein [Promethearchaeota archaeon]
MNKNEINFKLITQTHLTIGNVSTSLLETADLMQTRRIHDGSSQICIPATSFKGVLRYSAVQIAHFILGDEDYCSTIDAKSLDGKCKICKIFGAPNTPSKIICEDIFPIYPERIKIQNLTRTSIESKTGKVKEGALYSKEQIPPFIEFQGTITGIDLDDKEQLILLAALKNANYCDFGNGYGLIKLTINSIKNFNQKDVLISNLINSMKE